MQYLVRPPSDALVHALSEHPDKGSIDPLEARRQHAGYLSALRAAGLQVVELPPEPDLPDATFVWDTMLALPRAGEEGPTALVVMTRPGDPSRRPEVPSVEARLRRLLPADTTFATIREPGTMDAGDVIVYGRRVAIGVSARTNASGAQQLAILVSALGYQPFCCPVTDRLHLATAISPLGDDLLIGTPAGFASVDGAGPDAATEAEIRRLTIPQEEEPGANVLVAGGRAFVPAGNPTAAALMRGAGLHVVEVPLDQFTRADGGPTCLVGPIP
ncbi:MAG: dimethylarginine dimethylaminohydrolase family protein [Candidatus Dormibacteraceae bacterium]